MSETDIEVVPPRGMNEDEEQLAKVLYEAIMDHSRYSVRSQQQAEFRVGVSDLGFCSERLRRMLDRQVPEDTDELTAFIGTALGDHMEQAWQTIWPDAILQSEVTLTLQGESRTYLLNGHPDIIVPSLGLVIDGKSSYGFTVQERVGPSLQQQFQRHGYAKAAWEAGVFGDLPLEEVRVANAWIDRSGVEKRLHVHMEPYDPEVLEEATRWLEDVIYAYTHEEEARKEPPREMCAKTCGFFKVCRLYDTDVSGLLTDPEVVTALDVYTEGTRLMAEGRKMQREAKAHLDGVEGSTGALTLRWTWVNESEVPAHTRKGYNKIVVGKVK